LEDNYSISQINVSIPLGREVKINSTIRGMTPGYWKLGNNTRCRNMKLTAIDALEIMAELTPQEFRAIIVLKEDLLKYDDLNDEYFASCHVSYEPKLFNPTQKNQLNTGFNRLIKRGLLIREKRKHYMFNPSFIIPTNYEKEELEWIALYIEHQVG